LRADQVTAQLDSLPQFTFIRQGMLIAVDLAIATDIFGDMDAVVINQHRLQLQTELGPERPDSALVATTAEDLPQPVEVPRPS
jgi:hypothetical protein